MHDRILEYAQIYAVDVVVSRVIDSCLHEEKRRVLYLKEGTLIYVLRFLIYGREIYYCIL